MNNIIISIRNLFFVDDEIVTAGDLRWQEDLTMVVG